MERKYLHKNPFYTLKKKFNINWDYEDDIAVSKCEVTAGLHMSF